MQSITQPVSLHLEPTAISVAFPPMSLQRVLQALATVGRLLSLCSQCGQTQTSIPLRTLITLTWHGCRILGRRGTTAYLLSSFHTEQRDQLRIPTYGRAVLESRHAVGFTRPQTTVSKASSETQEPASRVDSRHNNPSMQAIQPLVHSVKATIHCLLQGR